MSSPYTSTFPISVLADGPQAINAVLWEADLGDTEDSQLVLQLWENGNPATLNVDFSTDPLVAGWTTGWVESSVPAGVPVVGFNALGLYTVPKLARFVRVRAVNATASGNVRFSVGVSHGWVRALASSIQVNTGQSAHDGAIAGNPMRIGARALSVPYAAVASGDVADLTSTLNGALIQKPFSIPDADWVYAPPAGGIVVATDIVVRAAQAAGIRNYVTAVQVRNTNAVATELVIKDGPSTVLWRTLLPANMAFSMDFDFPTPLRGTAATALNVQCVTAGAAVYPNLQGYSSS
jgi:hypothetical protein